MDPSHRGSVGLAGSPDYKFIGSVMLAHQSLPNAEEDYKEQVVLINLLS